MKKYLTPEMEMVDFIIDKTIASSIVSDLFYNDDEFGSWG